jgi:iron only hydrogenase large subunit-like protein
MGIDPPRTSAWCRSCPARPRSLRPIATRGRHRLPDVDAVITTRELARMIKTAGIDFVNLPDEEFDRLLGDSTGAAVIFGATGGVMEAALRTAL